MIWPCRRPLTGAILPGSCPASISRGTAGDRRPDAVGRRRAARFRGDGGAVGRRSALRLPRQRRTGPEPSPSHPTEATWSGARRARRLLLKRRRSLVGRSRGSPVSTHDYRTMAPTADRKTRPVLHLRFRHGEVFRIRRWRRSFSLRLRASHRRRQLRAMPAGKVSLAATAAGFPVPR